MGGSWAALVAQVNGEKTRELADTALQVGVSALDQIAQAKSVQTVLGAACVLLFGLVLVIGWQLLKAVHAGALADGKIEDVAKDVRASRDAVLLQVGEIRTEQAKQGAKLDAHLDRIAIAYERRLGAGG